MSGIAQSGLSPVLFVPSCPPAPRPPSPAPRWATLRRWLVFAPATPPAARPLRAERPSVPFHTR